MIWNMGLIVKLRDLGMPIALMTIIVSWLGTRQAYIIFGKRRSDNFEINIGLPQGSSLGPHLFIVVHCDLINCIGARSGHLFADDLSVLTRARIRKSLSRTMEYTEQEATRICHSLVGYSKKWKQPINVQKTVEQLFYTQMEQPKIELRVAEQCLKLVNKFKYLGFT